VSVPPIHSTPQDLPPAGYTPLLSPRTGMAVAALVCGIVGLVVCMPVGIVGLVLGIIATVRASRQPQEYGGRGLAIAGICTGGASLLLFPVACMVVATILAPALARAHEITKRAVGASNLRGIGQSLKIYAANNGGLLPPTLETLLADGSVTGTQLVNPRSGNQPPRCDYFYVTGLTSSDPAGWIVVYGDPDDDGGEGANLLYLDGTVKFVRDQPAGRFTQLLDEFRAEYEKARGQSPDIISPH